MKNRKRYSGKKKHKKIDYYWDIRKIVKLQTCLDKIAYKIFPFYIDIDPVDSLTYYEKLTDDIIDNYNCLKCKYTFYKNLVVLLVVGIVVLFLIGLIMYLSI